MKLSTRSTYGLRAMMAVAMDGSSGPVMVKEIAERHQLPANYLEQIMTPLRKGGLLAATRGAHGGYKLARAAQEITVREILETLEGSLELVECNEVACCGMQPDLCAVKDLLCEASRAMVEVLAQVTLADIVERQREKEAVSSALMYVI
jgi:Rrf2 family protein